MARSRAPGLWAPGAEGRPCGWEAPRPPCVSGLHRCCRGGSGHGGGHGEARTLRSGPWAGAEEAGAEPEQLREGQSSEVRGASCLPRAGGAARSGLSSVCVPAPPVTETAAEEGPEGPGWADGDAEAQRRSCLTAALARSRSLRGGTEAKPPPLPCPVRPVLPPAHLTSQARRSLGQGPLKAGAPQPEPGGRGSIPVRAQAWWQVQSPGWGVQEAAGP